jgi:hypothetical protein
VALDNRICDGIRSDINVTRRNKKKKEKRPSLTIRIKDIYWPVSNASPKSGKNSSYLPKL